ncbi:hypothetical protein [Caproiciproducens sp.]
MKIGIKYCGGCNPHYDRAQIVSRMRKEFYGLPIVNADEEGEVDLVVVICGCSSQCAGHAALRGRYGKVILTREQDYEKLRSFLIQILTK